MERIKFDDLQSKKARIIIIFSAILTLIGIFKPFNLFSEEIYKWLFALGVFILFIFFSRMFWFKNYVQWNKKGIVIKLNSWFGFGKSIKFSEIKSINFEANTIEFTLFGGRNKRIVDISKIDLVDRQRLRQILQKYSRQK